MQWTVLKAKWPATLRHWNVEGGTTPTKTNFTKSGLSFTVEWPRGAKLQPQWMVCSSTLKAHTWINVGIASPTIHNWTNGQCQVASVYFMDNFRYWTYLTSRNSLSNKSSIKVLCNWKYWKFNFSYCYLYFVFVIQVLQILIIHQLQWFLRIVLNHNIHFQIRTFDFVRNLTSVWDFFLLCYCDLYSKDHHIKVRHIMRSENEK